MKKYRVNLRVKIINSLSRFLIRLGLGPSYRYLLTVRGRKSGKSYSTPVTIVENDRGRWLVAPYGEVNWVRNARATRQVTLTRAGRSETLSIAEVALEESAPILKKYLVLEPITRLYFEAQVDSPVKAFQLEATRHPVFRLLLLERSAA
ncbi:MAG TPA: nitroreductase/quinone reductase family protein [Anaerolineales bacterium]|nr:nitroreductase/quinone reductase family protein [Anaerolineales bacterium]